MHISSLRLTQSVDRSQLEKVGFRFEHDTATYGWLDNLREDQFPWYETETDSWHPASENEAVDDNDILIEIEQGQISLTNLQEKTSEEPFVSPFKRYPLYSYPEILQFFGEMERLDEEAFADSYKVKKFQLSKVIEEVCISISLPDPENANFGTESFRFVRIADLMTEIGKLNGGRALRAAFEGDKGAMEYLGDWREFCASKGLAEKLESFHIKEFPVLFHLNAMPNSSSDLDPSRPVIGFRVNPGFSVQYLLDYLADTAEGKRLIGAIAKEIRKKGVAGNHFVHAPKTLGGQILHSIATRNQRAELRYQVERLVLSDVRAAKYRREFITRRRKMIAEVCDNIEKVEGDLNNWDPIFGD